MLDVRRLRVLREVARAGSFSAAADGQARLPDEVHAEPLLDDPLHVALPWDHPLATKDDLRMADLAEETWIEKRDRILGTPLLTAGRAAGFEPRIAFETAQWFG